MFNKVNGIGQVIKLVKLLFIGFVPHAFSLFHHKITLNRKYQMKLSPL